MAVLSALGAYNKMEKKFHRKSIFESGFDSFELDDAFLAKMDADVKKNSPNQEEIGKGKEGNCEEFNKLWSEGKKNDNFEKNAKPYDLSLFIEDFDESDLFDFTKTKNRASTKIAQQNQLKGREENLASNNLNASCLSPILGSKSFKKANISSSTPLKSCDDFSSNGKSEGCSKQTGDTQKTSEFDYLEADLFEDWNLDDINKCSSEKETVTLSQALQMVEEAEKSAEKEQNSQSEVCREPTSDQLNKSVDLLTGEVVGAEVESLFAESFDKLRSVEKEQEMENKDSSNDNEKKLDKMNVCRKPPAAQKLNFDLKNSNDVKLEEKFYGNICFDSDDDFDLFAQDLLKKVKRNSKYEKPSEDVSSVINETSKTVETPSKCDLNESAEDVISVKKRKNCNVIESDTTEDSPSPKFRRIKGPAKSQPKKQRNFKDKIGREFLDFEAEVSDEVVLSSDEVDEDEEYEESFVDDKSYFTQNSSTDLTAKYLQSVKSLNRPGTFKIPAVKPYNPEEVFSQVPQESNTDYQIDSFCVNDVEEEVKTDLSELEIAEKILEIDRKEKRKKRLNKSKKIR